MATMAEAGRVLPGAVEAGIDEAAARHALREQIARLERLLGDTFVTAFGHTPVDVACATASGGPRLLSLGELEAQRDALQAKLREARAAVEARGAEIEANRVLLERMFADPRRHKFARLHRADVGMGGCGAYQVRPRLGIIGMLMGWWQVKLSSGCPLRRPPRRLTARPPDRAAPARVWWSSAAARG